MAFGSCFDERVLVDRAGMPVPPQSRSPQAFAVRTTAGSGPTGRTAVYNSRFAAALSSRSWRAPQLGQSHSRIDSGISPLTNLHIEHILLDG